MASVSRQSPASPSVRAPKHSLDRDLLPEGGRSCDPEPVQVLGLLVADVHMLDRRTSRALPGEAHHRVDGVAGALEDGLDASVRVVADPSGDASRLRGAPGRVAEEDALHAAVDDDALTDHP